MEWLEDTQPRRYIPLDIGWFHSGADIMSSVPTTGVSDEFREQLWRFGRMSSVLMVGTVEPRKGHEQALDAFELLWDQGVDACLVIVGKEGWMVQRLATRIRHHVEAGKRLFWLESLSDEALSALYEVVDGVLAASLGEGFGLPLVEAAQHGTSILARDIPVFQEVAAQFATYFSGETPGQLAAALKTWLEAIKSNAAVASTGMRWKTWEGATRDIVRLLENRNDAGWLEHWMPKEPVHLTEREESG